MCSSVGLTRCISCAGLILSALSLTPVILIHVTNKNHKLMLPFLDTIQVDHKILFGLVFL